VNNSANDDLERILEILLEMLLGVAW